MMRYRWLAKPPTVTTRTDAPKQDSIEIGEVFSRYAAVWDAEDEGREIIRRGAFVETLGYRTLPLLYNHRLVPSLEGMEESPSIIPAGEILSVEEDDVGLLYSARFLDTSTGRDSAAAWPLLTGSSIGFCPITEIERDDGTIEVVAADLWEISLTEWPRQTLTQTTFPATVTAVASIFRDESARIRAAVEIRSLLQEMRDG